MSTRSPSRGVTSSNQADSSDDTDSTSLLSSRDAQTDTLSSSDDEPVGVIAPYNFEPEYDSDELAATSPAAEADPRLTSLDW